MAQNIPTDPSRLGPHGDVAPTPQNTPAVHTLTGSMISRPQIPPTLGEEDEAVETIGSRDAQGLGALAGNPAFASLVQNRLSGLIGRSSGYVESLPPAIQYRLTALKGVQRDHSALEAEFQKEIFELEKRFAEKYRPLYERRRAIIEGSDEPKDDEIEKGVKVEEEEEDEDEDDYEDDEDDDEAPKKKQHGVKPSADELAAAPKGIPEFWLTALKNHLGLSELITERDEECLRHLVDIRVTYPEGGKSGFTLVFEFGPGAAEFFDNKALEKTYYYQDEVGYEGDFVYSHAEGTQIQWKEGKDLTVKIETKKQRNKNTNQTRIVKKVVPTESFFTFFNPPKPPSDDDDDDASIASDLEEKLELDYQIGEDLKERVVPRAIDFFTGKALRFGQEADFDSEDYDDEFDDEDDDDEEGGRAPVPPMGNTPGSHQEPSECKQQ